MVYLSDDQRVKDPNHSKSIQIHLNLCVDPIGFTLISHGQCPFSKPGIPPSTALQPAAWRDQDKRCAALERLTKMLPKLQRPPRWIALENVKGAVKMEGGGKTWENTCVKEQKRWNFLQENSGFSQ